MPKNTFILAVIASLAFGFTPAWARPDTALTVAVNTHSGQAVVIPANAQLVAPGVFELTPARDPQSGQVVQGYAFVHYRGEYAHQPNHNPASGSTTNTCYAYLAKGAKWKSIESWVMNPANARSLDESAVFALESGALSKWEVAAGTGADIFGSGTPTTATLVADTAAPDGQNEVYFGNIDSPGAIALTIVWGVFAGPPSSRYLAEWDQVYDQIDFDWSAGATGVSGKMDFENIATHEDGHAAGMGHPSDTCVDETMYRFAGFGETNKRDLNRGDITGIDLLY